LKKSQELADEHWGWLGPLLEKFYKDAFQHGFKHGVEETEKNEKK
jgi:hypothetical protein